MSREWTRRERVLFAAALAVLTARDFLRDWWFPLVCAVAGLWFGLWFGLWLGGVL